MIPYSLQPQIFHGDYDAYLIQKILFGDFSGIFKKANSFFNAVHLYNFLITNEQSACLPKNQAWRNVFKDTGNLSIYFRL